MINNMHIFSYDYKINSPSMVNLYFSGSPTMVRIRWTHSSWLFNVILWKESEVGFSKRLKLINIESFVL